MKWSAVAAGILSCALLGTTVLYAQLGDIARKEAERRKTVQSTGKTYTNDNIKPDPSRSTAPASSDSSSSSDSASASGSSSPSSATDKSAADKATDKTAADKAADKTSTDKTDKPEPPKQVSADPAERKKEEAQWRERIKNERDLLERATSFAEALQSRINALSTDFVNRDDPQQRAKIAADRDKAIADLDRTKKEIDQHTKAIATIQEDARRAGAPAGWVR